MGSGRGISKGNRKRDGGMRSELESGVQGQEAQSADVKSLQHPSSRLPCWNDAGWGLRGSIALERKRRTDGVLHHTRISAGQISTVQIAEELGSALRGDATGVGVLAADGAAEACLE